MRMACALGLAFVLSLSLAWSGDGRVWKSEKDFRNAAPGIHRQALWLEENPGAEGWSDSLQTVLAWARGVPYLKLATAKVFEKEILNLPKNPSAGRVASMLKVGYAQIATQPGAENPTEFELARAGVTCMIRYYENAQRANPGDAIPAMERFAGFLHSDALDEFLQAKLRK